MDLKNKIRCLICYEEFNNKRKFTNHLRNKHNITQKSYYDTFFSKNDDGICPLCKGETTFRNLKRGYDKYCSGICASLNRKQSQETKKKISIANKKVSKKSKKKRNKTNLEKYGVENPYQSEKVKSKIKETIINKYGVENPAQSEIIKGKIKETNLKKYGVSSFLKTKDCRIKRHSLQLIDVKKRISEFNTIKPLFDIDKFEGIGYYIEYGWECLKCNNTFKEHLYSKNIPICPFCYPKDGYSSYEETKVREWIKLNVENVLANKFFSFEGKTYELDIYIPSHNLGIEFDGLYWHSELAGKDKKYHLEKDKFFKEHFNIEVIHIFENEWLYKQDIVKSIILNRLGLSEKRIYARKTNFSSIDNQTYKTFLEENHIQGAINSKHKYGLFYNKELISVIGYGKSRFKRNELELHRFCNKLNTSITGGFSKLIKNSGFKGSTYCDLRYFNAIGYKAIGFYEIDRTAPNYWYFKKNRIETLYSRIQFQKHKLKDKLKTFDPSMTEWENMKNNGWNRIFDCGNIKLEII